MTKKIKPIFKSESEEDIEKSEFEARVANTNYENAVSICRVSKDKKGHSCSLSFRMPDVSLRIVEEILSREKRFQSTSDVLRTAHLLGIKEILSQLKEKGVIGDHLDDALLAIETLNSHLKTEELNASMKERFNDLRVLSFIYEKDRNTFSKKVREMEKTFEGVRDPFWRKYLLNEFRKRVRLISNGGWIDGEDEDNF